MTDNRLSPEEEKYREFYDPCYECPWWRPECEVGEPPDECPQKEEQEAEDEAEERFAMGEETI
jgi:hypothetical protein